MGIRAILVETPDRWNSFISDWPDCGLLQTSLWGDFKQLMGWKAIRLAVENDGCLVAGALMLVKHLPLGLASIAYIPRGPLVNWHDRATTKLLLEALHQAARENHACFLRIEPPVIHSSQAQSMLQDLGFYPTAQTNQPRCTLTLPLDVDIDTLYTELPRRVRRDIRICHTKGVKIRQGDESDLGTFYKLMRTTASRGGFSSRSLEYYELEYKTFSRGEHTTLLLADYDGQTVAAQMPFAFSRYGAAFHGASNNTHRHLPINDLLTWEGIKWAKSRGCRSYDLWGIPDEVGELISEGRPVPNDRQDGLWGVYTFKKGFGGNITYYVGAYDYIYNKSLYTLGNNMIAWLGSNGLLEKM